MEINPNAEGTYAEGRLAGLVHAQRFVIAERAKWGPPSYAVEALDRVIADLESAQAQVKNVIETHRKREVLAEVLLGLCVASQARAEEVADSLLASNRIKIKVVE